MARNYFSPEEAFEARTVWQGDCLVWVGGRSHGYGLIRVLGKGVLAHRYAYEVANGPIPQGMVIDHICHNKACCNVEHLRAVTPRQNQEHRKGPRKDNTSGHLNVYWRSDVCKWHVYVRVDGVKKTSGQMYWPYDLHVAAYYARALRNKYHTYNDRDRLP